MREYTCLAKARQPITVAQYGQAPQGCVCRLQGLPAWGLQNLVNTLIAQRLLPVAHKSYREQVDQQVNGFSNNKYKGYTEKDGGLLKAEEDYIHYAASNQLPGAPLQTPPIKQNVKKKERPPSWQAERNAHNKARCTDRNSVLSEGSVSQMVSRRPPMTSNLPKRQTLVSRETRGEVGHVTNPPHCTPIDTNLDQKKLNSGISLGGELDDVMGQVSDANIVSVDAYNADITTIADDDWEVVPVEEHDTDQTEFDIHYPVIDTLSEDTGDAHGRAYLFQEQAPNDRQTASDKDSGNSTDYGDFPESITTQNECNTAPRTEPQLCDEQLELVDLIMKGRNVFYTGSAGCGKSAVLRYFVARLKERGSTVYIIAPTGRAALEVGGETLYSYAGWTPDTLEKPMKELEHNAHKRRNWKRVNKTDVLIIDEISMVENQILERLNRVMKSARGKKNEKKPFGGVQIIVTGDFCQLPPVRPFQFCMECGTELIRHSEGKLYECEEHGEFDDSAKWAFCSEAWKECDFVHFRLKKVHRQKEPIFKTILDKCRLGRPLDQGEKNLLLKHKCETTGAVKLFPTRVEVGRVNDTEMARLKGRSLKLNCLDNFFWNHDHVDLEKKSERGSYLHTLLALEEHRFEPILEMKENMVVILLINLDFDAGLINGSQGVIVGFETLKDDNHPQQYGDYKARKRGLIREFVKRAVVCEWPIVQFQNGVKRTIHAHCMMSELGDSEPYSLLSRTQVPLVAAWAMTIHKSQGMTLSRVIVDLSRTFQKAQDYVALSRASSLGGLKVEALGDRNWGCNTEVLLFLEEHGWLDC